VRVVKRLLAYLLVRRPEKKNGNLAALEERQPPGSAPTYNDSFYFCGRDADGTSLVFRLGFRPGLKTELWCDLILPGLGRFRAPYPDENEADGIACGPLRFQCREPGRAWVISYRGPMEAQGGRAEIGLELEFTADSPIVDFGAHGDSWGLAGYLAGQKWSRAWFEKLRDLSQVHYEQGGSLKGTVAVDGRRRGISLRSVRDHSFGARDWGAMQRHAWLMAVMEDGSALNLSLVSYDFLPYMHSGYRIQAGVIQPVTAAPRLDMLPAGSPKGAAFDYSVRIGGAERLTMRCRVDDVLEYVMGDQYRFYEGLATFRLGAQTGVGICEIGVSCREDTSHRPAHQS
jgi:hypothetical protein